MTGLILTNPRKPIMAKKLMRVRQQTDRKPLTSQRRTERQEPQRNLRAQMRALPTMSRKLPRAWKKQTDWQP